MKQLKMSLTLFCLLYGSVILALVAILGLWMFLPIKGGLIATSVGAVLLGCGLYLAVIKRWF